MTITLLLIIVAAGLFITQWKQSTSSFDDLNQEMQFLASDLVAKDKSVRNCVLSVMKGDGSFSWSGAAGIASQNWSEANDQRYAYLYRKYHKALYGHGHHAII